MKQEKSKEKILKIAASEFAERGFSGARVDEIARVAGVPKSLIYYHFKSKEEILEVLLRNFLEEYEQILSSVTEGYQGEAFKTRIKEVYYDFGEKNVDLIRVLWMDALKKNNDKPLVYQMIQSLMQKKGVEEEAVSKVRVQEFFTSILPLCSYICFKESWCSYFDEERKVFDSIFLDTYIKSHGSFHNVTINGEENADGNAD